MPYPITTLANLHSLLIEQMKALGYESNDNGICVGLSYMAMQAMICSDLTTFDQRLCYLNTLSKEALIQEINLLRSTIQDPNQPVDSRLDIPAFFEGIYLYLYLYLHPSLVEQPSEFSKFIDVIPLTLPKLLQNDGICQLTDFSGAYSDWELALYFESFAQAIDTNPSLNYPIALVFQNIKHTITIGYDCSLNQWYFFDSDQSPTQYIDKSDFVYLAEKVIEAFSTKPSFAKIDHCPSQEVIKTCERSCYFLGNEDLFFYSKLKDQLYKINTNEEGIKKLQTLFFGKTSINQLDYNQLSEITRITGHSLAKQESAIFDTKVFGNKAEEKALERAINTWQDSDSWKSIHKVTATKANLQDSFDISWLMVATYFEHLNQVQDLLANNAVVNHRSFDGYTSLLAAVQKGNLELIKLLLNYKANVNQGDDKGVTSLAIAAEFGYLDVITLLLQKGAEVNKPDNEGIIPICVAASYGHLSVVEKLLEAGEDINFTNNAKISQLHWAAQNNELVALQILLEKGALVDPLNLDGLPPLFTAAMNNHKEAVQLLLERSKYGLELLFYALFNGNIDLLKITLESGVDVNHIAANGINALYCAVQYNQAAAVALLLENGAKIDHGLPKELNPLLVAIVKNRVNLVEILLQGAPMPDFKLYESDDFLLNEALENQSRVKLNALFKAYNTPISVFDFVYARDQHEIYQLLYKQLSSEEKVLENKQMKLRQTLILLDQFIEKPDKLNNNPFFTVQAAKGYYEQLKKALSEPSLMTIEEIKTIQQLWEKPAMNSNQFFSQKSAKEPAKNQSSSTPPNSFLDK